MSEPENTIRIENVNWVEVKIHKLNTEGPAAQHPYAHTLLLPDFLARWDVCRGPGPGDVHFRVRSHLRVAD